MMVEWAVLLRQDDNVLHILNGAHAAVGWNCERLGDGSVPRAGNAGRAHHLQKSTPIGKKFTPFSCYELSPVSQNCEVLWPYTAI